MHILKVKVESVNGIEIQMQLIYFTNLIKSTLWWYRFMQPKKIRVERWSVVDRQQEGEQGTDIVDEDDDES